MYAYETADNNDHATHLNIPKDVRHIHFYGGRQ